ncbi:MAG: undecaprenyl-diphosphate phosphatase [Candidatus Dojkabacteria bacterium]|nr:undecaprenyl-diphosphate phosphatase [Candidatus Dojkabacteria bacterium]
MVVSEILQSVLAGIIQGITELLPVSSSGHLLLLSETISIDLSLTGIAILHLGTLIAILIVFRESLVNYFRLDTAFKIGLSIVPAGLIGLLFEETIERSLGTPVIITFSLFVWGIVLILVDRLGKSRTSTTETVSTISIKQALSVGFAQVLALIPGTSRSGITTAAGIVSGLSPQAALSFSFLSGIPLLAGTGLYSVYEEVKNPSIDVGQLIIATAVAAVTGIVAAYIFKKFIGKGILTASGIYRIVISIVLVIAVW